MKSLSIALGLFILSLVVSFILIHPSVKTHTQELLLDTNRKVLSQLQATYGDLEVKIIKSRDLKGIAIEVYGAGEGTTELIDRQELSDRKDAFYAFDKQKLNLFLKDINQDGVPEILVPTIDKNMIAHLNVFSFSHITRKLEKISEH